MEDNMLEYRTKVNILRMKDGQIEVVSYRVARRTLDIPNVGLYLDHPDFDILMAYANRDYSDIIFGSARMVRVDGQLTIEFDNRLTQSDWQSSGIDLCKFKWSEDVPVGI